MRVIVVTPPDPVVSYADAVARLKLAGSPAQQADIEAMIAAATAMLDGPTGWLGRALGEQTLELRCDAFSDCRGEPLRLPYPPVAAILSVKYLDPAGVEQTMSPSDYELIGEAVFPAFNASFPSVAARREAVRIRYSAGYDDVPEPIRAAILLATGDMFRFRETVSAASMSELPSAASIDRLLGTFRVYS